MKTLLFILQPEPGKIVQISRRCRGIDFVYGFCRAVLCAGLHVSFVGSFRRGTDPELATQWAEPCDFGIQSCRNISFDLTPEAGWMNKTNKTK